MGGDEKQVGATSAVDSAAHDISPIVSMPAQRTKLRRLFSEPLVHFMLFGGSAFWASECLVPTRDIPAPIVVTQERQKQEHARLLVLWGRPPTEDEVRQSLHEWVKSEALYREGLRLELDHNDALIRSRVIEKVKERSARLRVDLNPTEGELRKFLRENEVKYRAPVRYDLQIYDLSRELEGSSPGSQTARDTLKKVQSGEDLPGTMRPAQVRGRSREHLETEYGPDFAIEIEKMPVGEWALVPMKQGVGAVHLTGKRGGELAPEHKRQRALADFRKAREAEAMRQEEEKALHNVRVKWE